jgi:uncharacterized protein (TIGR03067 family)
MMAALLALFCLPLGWAAAEEVVKQPVQTDEAALQGAWVSLMGEPGRELEMFMLIEGNRVAMSLGGPRPQIKGTLTLRPTVIPKQMDLTITETDNPEMVGKAALGIYKLEVDGTWTLAGNGPGVAERPETFEAAGPAKVFTFRKWQPGMALPGIPPELKVLERRIGTWATEVVIQPGPWAPNGAKYTGTETVEWILGGRFQQTRFTGRPANQDSLSLLTYDAQRKAFRAWYHSDEGFSGEHTGQWDEAAQTLLWTSEMPNGMSSTVEWRFPGPDTTEGHVVIKNADGQVMFDMTAKAKRKADPEPPKAPAPR